MNFKKQFKGLLGGAILLLFSLNVSAQQNIALTTIKTKPGSVVAPIFTTLRQAMDETRTPFYWLVAQAASGEERLVIATLYDSYSFMDVNWTGALGQALETDELVQFGNAIQNSFLSMSTARYVARPDLSRQPATPPPPNTPPDAVIMLDIEVAPGRNADFEAYARQVIEATDATAPNLYWNMVSPVFGTNNYLVSVFIQEWEMLDTPAKSIVQRVVEHFGERRGGQLVENANEFVVSVKTDLFRTRPDLSRPAPQ